MTVMKWKMPENCIDCLGKLGPISHCPCEDNFEFKYNRHPECPIVGEISDKHGRIIDEKWVELYILKYFSIEFPDDMEKVCKLLKSALEDVPTVLEASK